MVNTFYNNIEVDEVKFYYLPNGDFMIGLVKNGKPVFTINFSKAIFSLLGGSIRITTSKDTYDR